SRQPVQDRKRSAAGGHDVSVQDCGMDRRCRRPGATGWQPPATVARTLGSHNMPDASLFIGLAVIFGLFMAWGIGANDTANAMATSVGSKALTIKQALLVAAIFEFTGAVLAGGSVTTTIRKGIVESSHFVGNPELLVFGMLA